MSSQSIQSVHAALTSYVATWTKANDDGVNFPSKMALNQWRKLLLDELGAILQRLLVHESEREKALEASKAEVPEPLKESIKADNHQGFVLVSYLNLVSLCQESTSFVIPTQERGLSNEQTKTNAALSSRLALIQKFLAEAEPTSKEAEKLLPHDDLLNPAPGKSLPYDRELILEVYYVFKRRFYGIKPSKAQKKRDGTGSQQILKMISNILAVSPVWPPEPNKTPIRFDTVKTMQRTSSDDRLIDMLATLNSRTMNNQRFVMSEQKERKMDLYEIFNVVDKLGDRFDNQTAMTREQRDAENLAKVTEAIDKASMSSMNNQRFTLSQEKIKQMTLTDLVNSVERLTSQRMQNQDAKSATERKKEMMSVVADMVEKMRASSMDDQRFVSQVASKMNMTAKELRQSIESLPLSESSLD